MNDIDIDENCQRFLIELADKTKGDLNAKISMYEIGSVLGMDKISSSRTAEVLMGWELIEIKTLSGAIAISSQGVKEVKKLKGISAENQETGFKLGNALTMDALACKKVELLVTALKTETSKSGLDFDSLSELIADLKTIDIQMTSPKPKTAIIRECFKSVKNILEKKQCLIEKGKAENSLAQVKSLLE